MHRLHRIAPAQQPSGGPILTISFKALLLVASAGMIVIAMRFIPGLGSVTTLSDGHTWGIWIAWDVVTGTALASSGYAMALAEPDTPLDPKGTKFDLPGGTIFEANLDTLHPITSFQDKYFRDNLAESIAHAWYGGAWTKHLWEAETVPKYGELDPAGKYSWVKAPRFQAVQVGPLAQVLVGYASGHEPIKHWTDQAVSLASSIAKTQLGLGAMHSTLGRHLARAIRTAVLAELGLKHWQLLVNNIGRGDTAIFTPFVFPKGEQRGFGFHEAPRGALVGTPIADATRPLEALRTVHSFDPCLACAIRTLDPEGRELAKVKVLGT
jgi:hydrogenase large subunit